MYGTIRFYMFVPSGKVTLFFCQIYNQDNAYASTQIIHQFFSIQNNFRRNHELDDFHTKEDYNVSITNFGNNIPLHFICNNFTTDVSHFEIK